MIPHSGVAVDCLLTSHDADRQRLSRCLQDDVAQHLLGAHVHLLALEKEICGNHASATKKIDDTLQLVAQSMEIIRSLDHNYRQHEI